MNKIVPIIMSLTLAIPKPTQAEPKKLPTALIKQMQAITNAANIVKGNTQENPQSASRNQFSNRSTNNALKSQMQAITNAADIVNGNTQEAKAESTTKAQSQVKAIRIISGLKTSFEQILKPLLNDEIDQI